MASIVGDEISPDEQLRRNVQELMHARHMKQVALALSLGRTQSWVCKRQSGKPSPLGSPWQIADLAGLAMVFGLAPWELLKPGIGRYDRRSYTERRRKDRRQYEV